MIEFLKTHSSIQFAVDCLNNIDNVELGLGRLGNIDSIIPFFKEPLLWSKLQNCSTSTVLLDVYVGMKIAELIFSKHLNSKQIFNPFLFDHLTDDINIDEIKLVIFKILNTCIDEISLFDESPPDSAVDTISNLALSLLPLLIKCIPPGQFHEWVSQSRKISTMTEKVLLNHDISKSLIESAVMTNCTTTNPSLKKFFSLSSKLLICSYSTCNGEINAELRISFPETWPARMGQIDVSSVAGLSKGKNSRLEVSVQNVFRLNGVQNAIQVWIENIEGFLKNVQECFICYSVTYHSASTGINGGSIPDKVCKNCNYKFHSQCLLKWFKQSQKTTCVLCQQPF